MTPAQKTQVVQKLMRKHSLDILLSIAQLPRATFYYHLKRMDCPDKYEAAKSEITAIYRENKGRYGYHRITTELYSRNIPLNHKTVHKLMKELGLVYRVRMKKYHVRAAAGRLNIFPTIACSASGAALHAVSRYIFSSKTQICLPGVWETLLRKKRLSAQILQKNATRDCRHHQQLS